MFYSNALKCVAQRVDKLAGVFRVTRLVPPFYDFNSADSGLLLPNILCYCVLVVFIRKLKSDNELFYSFVGACDHEFRKLDLNLVHVCITLPLQGRMCIVFPWQGYKFSGPLKIVVRTVFL